MAVKGWMGRLLFVDLSSGTITEESPDDDTYAKYIGGYGLGAYILYTRQKPKVDPLGPGNMLGILTGPLTGTPAISGNRCAVVTKSPKTGCWTDSNCGGTFGPALKWAGFDAVFFTGASDKPAYLLLDDGKAELRDASDLWGTEVAPLEDTLKERHGRDAEIMSIGPAGERQSWLAAIMNDKGRAAGRGAVGAVMGSKKLKAVVARGTQTIALDDEKAMTKLRSECMKYMRDMPFYQSLHTYGTNSDAAVPSGDGPVKNWGGSVEDFPNYAAIGAESLKKVEVKKYACWRCPIACGGHVKVESGPYAVEGHKPEYETVGAFGFMALNDNLESICKLNDICNRAGLDTISTGCTIAFAIECYENGLITRQDTRGLELTWGNHAAIVAATEQIAKGEGIAALLGNGMKAAEEKIGAKAEAFATHVQGEELPMHDPRHAPGLATSYKMDATPGRHTQFSAWVEEGQFAPPGLADRWAPWAGDKKYEYTGKAKCHRVLSGFMHFVNAAGVCMFGACVVPAQAQADFLTQATGKTFTLDDILEAGDRIAALRTAFNQREGMPNVKFRVPARVIGKPPLAAGPLKGIAVDMDLQVKEYLAEMGWDENGTPTKETLDNLGLDFVAADLHG